MSAAERWGEIQQMWCDAPGAGVHTQQVILSLPGTGQLVSTVGLAGASSATFAMLLGERLVVRLPPAQTAALIESGVGEASVPAKRTWTAVGAEHAERWAELVRDACWYANPGAEPEIGT